jgi:hypothetical protein
LACNEDGYLSTSRNRNADGRITIDLDSIIPSGNYYYHLNSTKSEALYQICRDAACLVSKWTDSITTSYTVAKTEEDWICNSPSSQVYRYQLVKNGMDIYLLGPEPLHNDSRNLFALRCDLRLAQFDQARFVIVPKSGQLVVHFLQLTDQSAQHYHNVQFDHKDSLSHELLYARFAWALMKIIENAQLDPKVFNFLRASEETISEQRDIEGTDDGSGGEGGSSGGDQGGGGGGSGGGKRKRKRDGNEDDDDGHYPDTSSPSRNLRSSKRVTSHPCPREGKT